MKRSLHRRTRWLVVPVALLAFTAASCSDDDDVASTGDPASTTATPTEDATFPVTIETDSGEVEIAEEPRRIVSLSATATEILFAIGAGDQVIAVDVTSDYPAEAPTTDLSAFPSPNIEAIAGYDPDLVVFGDELEVLDIPVLIQKTAENLDDTYEQIEQLGRATGHLEEAEELVADMKADIEEILADRPTDLDVVTYYHELDPTLFTATSQTFIGQLYELAGMQNVADPADDGSHYPQLTAEAIFAADPDFIFLADTVCCDQDAAAVAARPGWSQLRAVTEGNVVELDDSIASRWGPRVVDLLRSIIDALVAARAASG